MQGICRIQRVCVTANVVLKLVGSTQNNRRQEQVINWRVYIFGDEGGHDMSMADFGDKSTE
ncbi:hypothetical protein XM25_15150 [Devosia sp. H5989]|nr:hypothetical protein XM25_15150 [Devosia sp. H5989]